MSNKFVIASAFQRSNLLERTDRFVAKKTLLAMTTFIPEKATASGIPLAMT